MKNKSIVTVILVVVVCFALVLSFFLGRSSAEPEKQPAIPTTSTPTVTEEPTLTPTPTIVYAPDMGNYDLLSAYILDKIQQGPLKRYEVLWYIEESGSTYDYVTIVLRDRDYYFMKVVVVFQESEILDIFFIDSNDGLSFYHLEEDRYIPIQEKDVNFDGKDEILIFRGSYGNKGYGYYNCYFITEDGFVHCPSFDYIADPKINTEKQLIESWSCNSAVEHAGIIYEFIDGTFVRTEQLTYTYGIFEKDGTEFVIWILEKRIDGQMVVVETFSEEGMTDAEKANLLEILKTFDSYYAI